jgi:uncharacterized damage-inducible protein DinB
MIQRALRCCLMLVFFGMAAGQAKAADCGYGEALKTHWGRMRTLLTEIAAAMPEDKYDFRPVKEVRTFREMLQHTVTDGYHHLGHVAGLSQQETDKLTAKYHDLKTRDELLRALGETYDYGDKILTGLTDQNAMEMISGMRNERMTRVEAALVTFQHQMDHYGNFVVYLRMNGIVPPETARSQKQRQESGQQPAAPGGHQH